MRYPAPTTARFWMATIVGVIFGLPFVIVAVALGAWAHTSLVATGLFMLTGGLYTVIARTGTDWYLDRHRSTSKVPEATTYRSVDS